MTESTAPLSKARAEQSKRRRFETLAGVSFLAGAAEFLLVTMIAESLYPAYNVRDQVLSELGVGQVALLWNASLFLLGVAVIFGGYFAYRSMASRLSVSLSFILGIGCVGAAIFPLDSPIGVHGLFTFLAFAAGGLFALTSYRVVGSKGMKSFSIIFGVYSLVSVVLHAFNVNLGLGGGGMERMIVFPLVVWLSAFGGYLLNTRNA